MGQVLQCPTCRASHPLDRHGAEMVFPCSQCGRPLKVPDELRAAAARGAGAGAGARSADPDATAAVQAPRDAATKTTVFPAAPKGAAPRAARRKPRMIWRLAAWALAVIVGGVIVFVGGRAVGYLSGQRALDVVITSGIRRYTVLLPLVPVWALITTLLVTVLLDGPRVIGRRRRARASRSKPEQPAEPVARAEPTAVTPRADTAGPPASRPDARPRPAAATVPDDTPPPRRPGEGRRAGGHRR